MLAALVAMGSSRLRGTLPRAAWCRTWSTPWQAFFAVGELPDVAFDEVEAGPLFGGDQGLDFVQVALVAGGEVVQADDALVEFEQGLQQVGADEAGHAGDEPGAGGLGQVGQELFVGGGHGGIVVGPGVTAWRRPRRRAGCL
jgi:hypothetical protein